MSSNRGYNNFREESQRGRGSLGSHYSQRQPDEGYHRREEDCPRRESQRNPFNGPTNHFRSNSSRHPDDRRLNESHRRSRSPERSQDYVDSSDHHDYRNQDRQYNDRRYQMERGGSYGPSYGRRMDERRAKYERLGIASVEELAKVPARNVASDEKRKLLWQSSKKQIESNEDTTPTAAPAPAPSQKIWQGVAFEGDTDGSVAQKFKKLMGVKEGTAASQDATSEIPTSSQSVMRQDELFRNLNTQYEKARLSAHTQRGLGLGFGR